MTPSEVRARNPKFFSKAKFMGASALIMVRGGEVIVPLRAEVWKDGKKRIVYRLAVYELGPGGEIGKLIRIEKRPGPATRTEPSLPKTVSPKGEVS